MSVDMRSALTRVCEAIGAHAETCMRALQSVQRYCAI